MKFFNFLVVGFSFVSLVNASPVAEPGSSESDPGAGRVTETPVVTPYRVIETKDATVSIIASDKKIYVIDVGTGSIAEEGLTVGYTNLDCSGDTYIVNALTVIPHQRIALLRGGLKIKVMELRTDVEVVSRIHYWQENPTCINNNYGGSKQFKVEYSEDDLPSFNLAIPLDINLF